MTVAPVGWFHMYAGALPRNHALARSMKARTSTVETSPKVAVTRVADLSMLMRSLRSNP